MPPKKWDEEESEGSDSAPETAPVGGARRKFDDEEDDGDVLDSWDAAEDSEVEREKAAKAAAAKEKAAAAAAAAKKPKSQRVAEHIAERARIAAESDEESDDETEAERRERLRRTEQEADLKHAEDLFGSIGISAGRKSNPSGTMVADPNNPTNLINLANVPVFNPQTKLQFEKMRTLLTPLITANTKKAHYGLFLEEFAKELVKELNSDQIKKIASTLTRASNEKLKEEKAGDKKKTKAAKTKTSLVTSRANAADTATYDDDAFGDDDFM
ncbi:Eukaryotic translation initiation factor 3 subunit J [Trichoderma simmonsii]|uniref:Eukaryotic translation initiation factor 3 subunit J n=1 Tax=Trichoderma simmonsii TaxID=1491479 RepID=A0A8G0PJV9_9HYPO|nr:Eukaryotic translation initiation factor 3 subunit J [Trichoderma simmonsii]